MHPKQTCLLMAGKTQLVKTNQSEEAPSKSAMLQPSIQPRGHLEGAAMAALICHQTIIPDDSSQVHSQLNSKLLHQLPLNKKTGGEERGGVHNIANISDNYALQQCLLNYQKLRDKLKFCLYICKNVNQMYCMESWLNQCSLIGNPDNQSGM